MDDLDSWAKGPPPARAKVRVNRFPQPTRPPEMVPWPLRMTMFAQGVWVLFLMFLVLVFGIVGLVFTPSYLLSKKIGEYIPVPDAP